jgi:phosphoribosylamine--glycine ligase
MVVSGGYPEDFEKGKEISGLSEIEDSIVFHAGTKLENGKVLSNGGRVLTVTSYGDNFEEAIKKSYQNIDKLHFDKMYFRKDIGNDLK